MWTISHAVLHENVDSFLAVICEGIWSFQLSRKDSSVVLPCQVFPTIGNFHSLALTSFRLVFTSRLEPYKTQSTFVPISVLSTDTSVTFVTTFSGITILYLS